MSDRPPAPEPTPEPAPRAFSERLSVPWWWWPPVLVITLLLAAGMHLGYPGLRAWLPYVLLVPLAVGGLIVLGRPRVGVGPAPDDPDRVEVHAGGRRLDRRHVGAVDVVRGADRQDALGPQLDPTAYVLQRPWVSALVRLEVLDAADPAPYWVVSTRHPERLVAAVATTSPVRPRSRGR